MFPVFYKEEELKIMKGTYLRTLVKGMRRLIQNEYKLLKEKGLFKKEIQFIEYMKARIFVNSKCLNVTKDKENLSILSPLIDQIRFTDNDTIGNSNWFFENNNLIIKSERKLNEGEELMIKFPSLSNQDSLLNYGRTTNNNLARSEVVLDLVENDDSSNREIETVTLHSLYDINQVMSEIRQVLFNETNSISLEIEANAINILKNSLKATNNLFPTNYTSDLAKLNNKDITKNEENIYRVISEEKKRINAYLNIASFFDDVLKLVKNKKPIDDNMMKKISNTKAYKNYYLNLKDNIKNYTFPSIPTNIQEIQETENQLIG